MVFRSQNILVFHNHSVFGLLDVLLGVIIIYPSPICFLSFGVLVEIPLGLWFAGDDIIVGVSKKRWL